MFKKLMNLLLLEEESLDFEDRLATDISIMLDVESNIVEDWLFSNRKADKLSKVQSIKVYIKTIESVSYFHISCLIKDGDSIVRLESKPKKFILPDEKLKNQILKFE